MTLFGCPISNEGLAKLSALGSLETLTVMAPSQVTVSGLNCLNGLSRLSNLRADSLRQDGPALNIAGLHRLEYLMLTAAKGSTFRDEDLACLGNLKRLKWVQIGSRTALAITDAGVAHLAELTSLERLAPTVTPCSTERARRVPATPRR